MTRLGIATGVPSSPEWKSIIPIVLSIISLCGMVVVAYAKNDKEISNRVTAIETKVLSNEGRFTDIKDELRHINDKLDRLIERAR